MDEGSVAVRLFSHKKRPSEVEVEITAKRCESRLSPSIGLAAPSKWWLTKRALREFDRRTFIQDSHTEPSSQTSYPADIKRFARTGGPDMADISARMRYQMGTNSKSLYNTRQSQSRTGTTSAYDRNFEQILSDNSICMINRTHKPSNWKNLQETIAEPRSSLSSSQFAESEFEAFVNATVDATSEAKVMRTVFPKILGDSIIPSGENLLFCHLFPIIDGVTTPKPDLYDGVRPDSLLSQIRKDLSSFITPSTQPRAPILPNFFAEIKGPDGSLAVAQRQACFDGVIGSRCIRKLQEYKQTGSKEDNAAYSITSTYQSGFLRLYTVHVASDGEYKMTLLRACAVTDSRDSFFYGASALRNARDWARNQREIAVDNANRRWEQSVQSGAGDNPKA